MDSQQASQQASQLSHQQQQPQTPPTPYTDTSSCSTDILTEIERQKLYFLDKIAREQEKINNRLHSIIENQKQECRNQDRMIELLYRIAYNK